MKRIEIRTRKRDARGRRLLRELQDHRSVGYQHCLDDGTRLHALYRSKMPSICKCPTNLYSENNVLLLLLLFNNSSTQQPSRNFSIVLPQMD
jgi:hypothetical protein